MSGLGGMMAQGMAFGAGSEMAHSAIRSMTGGGSGHGAQQEQQQQAPMEQQQSAPQDQYQQEAQQDQCASFNMNLV